MSVGVAAGGAVGDAGGGEVISGPIVGNGVTAAVGACEGEGVAGEAVGVAFEHAPLNAMIRTTATLAEAQCR